MINMSFTRLEATILKEAVAGWLSDRAGDGETLTDEQDDHVWGLIEKLKTPDLTVPETKGWSMCVSTPSGEIVMSERGLPTVYDVHGVVEEYLADDDNEGV